MTANERSRLFEKTLPGIVRLALSLPTLVTVVSTDSASQCNTYPTDYAGSKYS